jgi:hypothetical protein
MISNASDVAGADTGSTWRGVAVCGVATVGAILVGAVPALVIGLALARHRYVERWDAASSGLLDGESERALFVAGVGVLLAALVTVGVFRFVARVGRATLPAPRVVAGCAVLVATSVLTVLVVVALGSPTATGMIEGTFSVDGASSGATGAPLPSGALG